MSRPPLPLPARARSDQNLRHGGWRSGRWFASATTVALALGSALVFSPSATADDPGQPVPDGIYLASPWVEPGGSVVAFFVGESVECGDGYGGFIMQAAFVGPDGATELATGSFGEGTFGAGRAWVLADPVTYEPLTLGSTGAVSGEFVLTCMPSGGGATSTVSMPLTISPTAPATIYNSPTAWTWSSPSDLTSGGAQVTISALGFQPGETVRLSLINEDHFWEPPVQFAASVAGPLVVTADGEGAVTGMVTVPSGWNSDDYVGVVVAGEDSRYLLTSSSNEWNDGTEPGSVSFTGAAVAGGTVGVTSSGFDAGETVVFALHSLNAPALQLAALTANASGVASGTITIPGSVTPGGYRLWAGASVLNHNLYNTPLTVSLAPTADRLAGDDRFATAAAISSEYSATGGVVYVANGLNFPDALAAAPAAAFRDAPLLLVEFDTIPAPIRAELERLQPSLIVVAGGEGVVSPAVFAELGNYADAVERHAGDDRYATGQELVAEAFGADGASIAFIATGANFPDALAAAAAAGKLGSPVILVPGDDARIDNATANLLSLLDVSTVYIAGGTGVVSQGIEDHLGVIMGDANVMRLAGEGRYDTSAAINGTLFDSSSIVYLAVGTGYADALAGAALAGKGTAPLFIVPTNCIPGSTYDKIIALGATTMVLLGGIGVLDAQVASFARC